MADATPTQSDNAQVSSTAVSGDWQRLANLGTLIRELSNQQCMQDLRHLFQHADSLQATVKQQETTIAELNRRLQAQIDESNRLVKEHKDRQEEVIESHARLLRKKDDEKVALNQAFTRQESDLHDSKTSAQQMKEHVQSLNDQLQQQVNEIEKIEAHLR